MTADIHHIRDGRGARQTLPPPHNIEAEQALLGFDVASLQTSGAIPP